MDVVATINNAAENTTVKIPAGTYTVAPKIKPKRGVTVDLTGVTLKIPAQTTEYHFFLIEQPGITLRGGTLVGDRDTSKRDTTKQNGGYGVRIRGEADNTRIENTTCSKMWADGFIIHGGSNIRLKNVVGDSNRRQGLSICAGQDIQVLDSVFKNTAGIPPQAGIDIEPWEKSQLVKDVLISGCQLLNNRGHGITINARLGPVKSVIVKNCIYKGNGKYPLNYWGWSKLQAWFASIGWYRPTSIVIA
jgi:hypothetical protein